LAERVRVPGLPITPDERAEVLRLLARRVSNGEIARRVGCGERTVRRIKKAALRRPIEAHIAERFRNSQIRECDAVAEEHWDAWRRSNAPEQVDAQKVDPETGQIVTLTTLRERIGDPRFLSGVLSALAEQRKLLGIGEHAPKSDGDSTPAEFAQAVGAALRRLGQPPAPDPVEPGTVQ
jgi:hypothetical protein